MPIILAIKLPLPHHALAARCLPFALLVFKAKLTWQIEIIDFIYYNCSNTRISELLQLSFKQIEKQSTYNHANNYW
jgi:hypothetical protein